MPGKGKAPQRGLQAVLELAVSSMGRSLLCWPPSAQPRGRRDRAARASRRGTACACLRDPVCAVVLVWPRSFPGEGNWGCTHTQRAAAPMGTRAPRCRTAATRGRSHHQPSRPPVSSAYVGVGAPACVPALFLAPGPRGALAAEPCGSGLEGFSSVRVANPRSSMLLASPWQTSEPWLARCS